MKTVSKFLPGVVLAVLVLDSSMLNAEGQAGSMDVGAEVEAVVAADVAKEMRSALAQPRAARAPRQAAVEVIDPTYIVVEASRLPAEAPAIRTAQAGF